MPTSQSYEALANQARLEYLDTPTLVRNASAAKTYAPEVARLTSALKTAQLNAPKEREAQRIANAQVKAKVQANNVTDKDEISKIRRAAISDARVSTGASGKGTRITISDGEWEAIQAGAISDTTLKEILRYSDPDVVRERATPRASTQLSEARVNRIKRMAILEAPTPKSQVLWAFCLLSFPSISMSKKGSESEWKCVCLLLPITPTTLLHSMKRGIGSTKTTAIIPALS